MTCIIVITAHKEKLTPSEEYSLRRCKEILGRHDVVLVCPVGMNTGCYTALWSDLAVDAIPPHWQHSYDAFNHLKVHPFLYDRYKNFDYMLFHELDALVFSDKLDFWCDQGFDYIGAPWFECVEEDVFCGVGNGGFSLRRISAMRRVARTWRYIEPAWALVKAIASKQTTKESFANVLRKLTLGNNFHYFLNDYSGLEDVFWGRIVPTRFPWYKVAPPEIALKFSFEARPLILYAMNDDRLPFGCHAWQKWHPEFYTHFFPELAAFR